MPACQMTPSGTEGEFAAGASQGARTLKTAATAKLSDRLLFILNFLFMDRTPLGFSKSPQCTANETGPLSDFRVETVAGKVGPSFVLPFSAVSGLRWQVTQLASIKQFAQKPRQPASGLTRDLTICPPRFAVLPKNARFATAIR